MKTVQVGETLWQGNAQGVTDAREQAAWSKTTVFTQGDPEFRMAGVEGRFRVENVVPLQPARSPGLPKVDAPGVYKVVRIE